MRVEGVGYGEVGEMPAGGGAVLKEGRCKDWKGSVLLWKGPSFLQAESTLAILLPVL